MKIVAMIPARLEATRFPNKLMQDLEGMSVILRTYRTTFETGLFDAVYVVTDSDVIYNEIISNGGKAIISKKAHESGSDRIAEVIEDVDADVVINVQGDEPFTNKETLNKLIVKKPCTFLDISLGFSVFTGYGTQGVVGAELESTLDRILTFHTAPSSYDVEYISGDRGISQVTNDEVVVGVIRWIYLYK